MSVIIHGHRGLELARLKASTFEAQLTRAKQLSEGLENPELHIVRGGEPPVVMLLPSRELDPFVERHYPTVTQIRLNYVTGVTFPDGRFVPGSELLE